MGGKRKRLDLSRPIALDELRAWTDQPDETQVRAVETKTRLVKGRAPQIATVEYGCTVLTSEWFIRSVDQIGEVIGQRARLGRPRTFQAADFVFIWLMQFHFPSRRKALTELVAPRTWEEFRKFSAKIWPKNSPYRLSPRPITPTAWYRIRRTHVSPRAELIASLNEAHTETNTRLAIQIGLFDAKSGTASKPSPRQLMAGDSTWLGSRLNSTREVDPVTGEIIYLQEDPDARRQPGKPKWGQYWATVLARTEYGGERVILTAAPVLLGTGDGTVASDLAIDLKKRFLPEARAFAFDMNIAAPDQERLFDHELIPIIKTSRVKGHHARQGGLGNHTFALRSGKRSEIAIHTVDGRPCLRIPVQGTQSAVPLIGGQIHWRPTSCYRYWSVPDDDTMPDHLRGARTRIRHNSTEEERRKGRLRTTHLRVFPESDPQFRGLHGIRQDTESNHANLKSLLDDDRARSNGLTNQRLDMMAWAIYSNLRAALSHTHRTGLPPPVIRAHDPPHAAAA